MPWFGCVWFVLLEWADGMCQDNEFKGVKFWKIMGCGSRIILAITEMSTTFRGRWRVAIIKQKRRKDRSIFLGWQQQHRLH